MCDLKQPVKASRGSKWRVLSLTVSALAVPWYLLNRTTLGLTITQDFSPDSVYSAFLKTLEESNLADKWQRKYGSQPQLAGTNMEMVNWTKDKFAEFGLDASVDNYTSWMSYPEESSIKLLTGGEVEYEPTLKEDPVDEWSTNFSVPAFLGYGPNGNVTAQYVYCGFGSKEDFDRLEAMGVELKGKVAIIRYLGIFRGLKVKFAQEHGMIGALLFSDPYEDGKIVEQNGYKAYPEGPARQSSAIQRGSVQFLSAFGGDPTTPGYAIKPGENKTRGDPYLSTPRIPVLPVSSREIAPILAKLNGHGPSLTESGFPIGLIEGFDYSVGPNPDYEVNVYSKQNFTVGVMHNVMGKIEGENPEEVIIVGNHHDSWTYDGGDPHSGTASMLEIIRSLSELLKVGWRPKRTIIFATWDGEEYGLLGSTEFGEYWAETLKKKVVAYLNMDMSASGPDLLVEASPLLFDIVKKCAKKIDYNSSMTLYEHFEAVAGGKIGNLGSGSDYSVFLDHLGIPSVDMSFEANENSAAYLYHSIYDNYNWMEKYGDPGFRLHNIMSRFLGLILLHLSETKVIQLTTEPYSVRLQEFFNDVVGDIPKEWMVRSAFGIKKDMVCVGDLVAEVQKKLAKLAVRSARFDSKAAELQQKYEQWNNLSYWRRAKLSWQIRRANSWLKYYERHFLKKDGLRDRPWFKHIVFASGRYTGYAGQQLPGMTESIEDLNFDEFVKSLKFFHRVVGKL